jgi:diaminohydroxyphosphoribosylaminopyrimidine deaminase/5-amino-6-(5-phosphoribosylamino)uracil reductase
VTVWTGEGTVHALDDCAPEASAGAFCMLGGGMTAGADDRTHMEAALKLAARARGYTSPNPMVGAVIVKDGRVVGTGFHERAGAPHAEVRALEAAGDLARGATIYVTLEPCCVWGRTPPCTDAIIAAGISRVVAPFEDPNPDVSGRGFAALRAAGIEVTSGVLEGAAAELNEAYLKWRRSGLPAVTLKLATSLDGSVAAPPGGPRWLSSEESRRLVHEMRGAADCVAVGVGTVLADDPLLTDRREPGAARQPARLVFDRDLRIPIGSALVGTSREIRTIVACAAGADDGRSLRLERAGVEIWRVAASPDGVDPEGVMRAAAAAGLLSVLVEGGPRVATSLLGAGLVDRLTLFVAPVLHGRGGRGAFEALDERWWSPGALEDVRVSRVGPDLLVEARVARAPGARSRQASEEARGRVRCSRE